MRYTRSKTTGTFGVLVRRHRQRLRFPMADLARAAELDQGLLSKIERGLRPPPQIVPYVQRMAATFGFEPDSSEYCEVVDAAYRERFGDRPKGGLVVTLGFPTERAAARGLGGLPPEYTAPDSPAGRHYASLGLRVGGALREESASPVPASITAVSGPPSPQPLGGALGAALFGNSTPADDPGQVGAWLARLVSSTGGELIRFQVTKSSVVGEIRSPDGRVYELRLREKKSQEVRKP